MSRRVLGLALILACGAQSARAAKTIVVAADGSGDAKTILEANDLASDGDTIMLRGTGRNFGDLMPRQHVRYQGSNWEWVNIVRKDWRHGGKEYPIKHVTFSHLSFRAEYLYQTEDVTFEDCLFIWGPRPAFKPDDDVRKSALVSIIASKNITIRGCWIEGSPGAGVQVMDAPGSIIENNVVTQNWYTGISIDSNKVEVAHNTVIFNQFLQPGFDGDALRRYWEDHASDYERKYANFQGRLSSFRTEAGTGINVSGKTDWARNDIHDNVSAWNEVGFIMDPTHSPVLRNNVAFGNFRLGFVCDIRTSEGAATGYRGLDTLVVKECTDSAKIAANKNRSDDPHFVDPDGHDFHFAAGSYAATAGLKGAAVGASGAVLELKASVAKLDQEAADAARKAQEAEANAEIDYLIGKDGRKAFIVEDYPGKFSISGGPGQSMVVASTGSFSGNSIYASPEEESAVAALAAKAATFDEFMDAAKKRGYRVQKTKRGQ